MSKTNSNNKSSSLSTSQNKNNTKKVDLLPEDPPFKNYKYFNISFVSPEGVKNCNLRLVKVRGVYRTQKEAIAHAKELGSLEDIPILTGDLGKWCPWDQTPSKIKNLNTDNEEAQDLMRQTLNENNKAKKHMRDRVAYTRNNEQHRRKQLEENSKKAREEAEYAEKQMAKLLLNSNISSNSLSENGVNNSSDKKKDGKSELPETKLPENTQETKLPENTQETKLPENTQETKLPENTQGTKLP